VVHQVGFSLRDYAEMHGQQNTKKCNLYPYMIITYCYSSCTSKFTL